MLRAGALLAALPIIQACQGAAPAADAPSAKPAAQPSGTTAAAGQPAAPAKASGAPVKISHWQIGGKVFEEFFSGTIVPGFKQQQPSVEVEQTILGGWDELYQKVVVASAAGTPPDVIRGKEFWLGDFAARDVLADLTPSLSGQTTVSKEKFMPQPWEGTKWNGRQVALPLHIFVRQLFYNKELLDKAGAKPPTTWDEWTATAQKITDPAKGIWGTILYNYTGTEDSISHFQYMLHGAGGTYWDDQNKKFVFNSAEGLAVLKYQIDQMKSGACLPFGADTTDTAQIINTGRAGLWITGAFAMADYAKNAPGLKYGLALFPKNKTNAGVIRANNLYLFKASKYPAEAFSYMAYMMQEEPNRQYAEKMSYVMPLLATQKRDFYQQSEEWKVALQQTQLPDNTWQVYFPGYTESAAMFAAELQQAYLGSKSPEQALSDGEKAASEALKSFKA